MATLKDIALRTGVSVNTVSLALRGSPRVGERTREKILEFARALDYTPNHAAQALVTRRNMTVGLLLTDMTNPVLTQVAQKLEIELKAKGYVTLLAASNGDGEEQERALATFRSRQLDGVFVYPNHRRELDGIRRLAASGMPVVLLAGKEVEGLDVVTIDEQHGSALAARHLIALGHRRIGLIDSDRATGNSEKIDGYRQALLEAGIEVDPALIVGPGGHSVAQGYGAMGQLLRLADPPTAVLSSTDRIAMGALRWCEDNGVDVPGDVSVFGYDNVEYAEAASTPLSSVDYPAEEIARAAAGLILRRIEGEPGEGDGAPERIILKPELALRASTGARG
ncbi:LacI family DNA-binding transcriptional regulator [Wenxinia marina]|uniref:LacI family DNA-binding transcriptional regulator n=1 Tax=Wenxinia marina TaxID=390641 RepID=UPI00035DC386|nr:LacI family DNA-binding transcriptional regulator [Wenxinia marina]